jgi:multidrug efflux system outer membrane protein
MVSSGMTFPSIRTHGGAALCAFAVALLGTSGCAGSHAPDLDAGLPEPPAAWTGAPSTDADVLAGAPVEGWLADFDAPGLAPLVEQALAANPDLAAAAARVAQARAQARIAGAPRLPQAEAGFSAARTKRAPSGISSTSARPVTTYGLDASISWEADLWGRLGDTARAAVADAEASRADLEGARLALAAEVARGWFLLAEAAQQEALAEHTVDSFTRSRRVIEERYRAGIVTALDVRLARENEATARSVLAQRRREHDAATRALEVLLGRYPAGGLQPPAALPAVVRPVPVGLPSELLERRPDLVAARTRLAAADARVRAARKNRLPSISLTATGGTASDRLRDLLDWDHLVWSLVSGITQPIFSGGRLSAESALAKARDREALAAYARAALDAFREVEAALNAEGHYTEQERALRTAAAESHEAASLAAERYGQGLIDIVTLLESQRRAFDAESARLRTVRDRLDNRVDLYLALGGDFAVPGSEATEATP